MSRICRHLSFLMLLLYLAPVPSAAAQSVIGTYPIPTAEMKEQVIYWLQGEGIQVSKADLDRGHFSLVCGNARQTFRIEIAPRSPLASSVRIEGLPDAGDTCAVITRLKASLDAYVRGINSNEQTAARGLPHSAASYERTVFCLSARSNGHPLRFSGFAVDRKGLIITTAHDLEGIHRVEVRQDGGIDLSGRVLRRDPLRDLTLIKVDRLFEEIIPVRNGRRSLQLGDRVYSPVCASSGRDSVRVGIIDETPAVVNGQPLWRVTMEVKPGSSGSPVFDFEGRLAGIVKGRFRGTETSGFMIPLDTIRDFLVQGER